MYDKICIAVDGSDSSLKAVRRAAKLASICDAELFLLHIVRRMQIPDELRRFVNEDDLATMRRAALKEVGEEVLLAAKQEARDQGASQISASVVHGEPGRTIVEQALLHDADLIVVGTRGLGQVEGLLMGSISRRVTETARMSVLVIK